MNRRQFLQNTALITASGLLANHYSFAHTNKMKNIGVQLFSLPKMLEKDVREAMQMLASIGYKELELYGPYPYSADSAKTRWKSITPSLSFSGSGYFGLSPQQFRQVLNENGLTAPAMHTDLETLETRMEELGEAGQFLGFTYVGLPAIPDEKRSNLDSYKKMGDVFNSIGEKAKKAGLKFTYHNHGYGLQETEGKIPLQIILKQTDPDLVFFEMDIYWMTAGGADPVLYLDKYPGRYRLMHLKDMKEKVRFSGDGGDAQQWIALFPYMASAGQGVLDLPAIIKNAQKSGVEHFFVEQDMVENPGVALKKSYKYLSSLK